VVYKIPFKDLKPETQAQIRELLRLRSERLAGVGGLFSVGAASGMLPLILYSAKTNPSEYANWYAHFITKEAIPIAGGVATAFTVFLNEARKANEQVKNQSFKVIKNLGVKSFKIKAPKHEEPLKQYLYGFVNRKGDVILTREKEAKTIFGKILKKFKRFRVPL